MASKKIEVIIAGDTTKLASSLKSAGVQVTEFADKTDESSGKLSKFKAAAAVAATGGALALGNALKSSVEAAGGFEQSQARMTQAFKAAGVPLSKYSDGIEDAESKGRSLGFSDEDVQSALVNMVTATHSGTDAIKDLGVEEDYARDKHVSLAAASKTVTSALAGSSRAAHSLGIVVPPVTTAMDNLSKSHLKAGTAAYENAKQTATMTDRQSTAQKVIGAVSQAVKGQADAYSKTGVGAMAAFKAQVQNLQVEIGQALIPVLTKVQGVLVTVVTWITKHKSEAEALGIAIGGVVVAVKAWSIATNVAKSATEAWTAAQALFDAAMDADPIVLVIAAVVAIGAAIVIAYKKIQTFRDIVNTAFGVVKSAVQIGIDIFNKIKSVVATAFTTIKSDVQLGVDKITGAKDTITGAFNKVISIIGDVVDFVKNNWKLIAPLILGPIAPIGELVTHFGLVKDAVGKVWSAISGGVATAISDVKSVATAIGGIPANLLGIVKGVASAALSIGTSIVKGIGAGISGAASFVGSIGKDIGNAIIGAVNSVIGDIDSVIGKLGVTVLGHHIGVPSIPQIPTFATGTDNAPGGWALVGEEGPELVNVPKGSQIATASKTRQMFSKNGGATAPASAGPAQINIDMRGAKINSPRSARVMANKLAYRLATG